MFYTAFPSDLKENLDVVLKIIPNKSLHVSHLITSENVISYMLDNNRIEFPYRVYFTDITEAVYDTLSRTQQQILCCIYTRHCDGYIREKYLRKLLDSPFEPWCIPFIVKLCDEYVLEIIEIIYNTLKERDNTDIQAFCFANKASIRKSHSRMISYWNIFYRGHEFELQNYLGRKLFGECFGYDKTFER